MSSSSSSSSSARSCSPEPPSKKPLKRKRKIEEEKVISDESESSSESGASDSEEDEAPQDGEPVLSHAERRRQKKRTAVENDPGAQDAKTPNKKRKLKDGSAVASQDAGALPKRSNSVWVGNMSFKTTQENLRTFFAKAGEVTRINMPTKAPTRPNLPVENRGFAYVDFATPEAKAAAIALSEQPLIGRKLLIKDGDDFSGRPLVPGAEVKTNDSSLAQKTHSKTAQKILRKQKQPPAPTLFLGNLPFETTDDDIRGLFEAHQLPNKKKGQEKEKEKEKDKLKPEQKDDKPAPEGEKKKPKDDAFILKIRMGTFEDSGMCKGFAFVDFSSIDNATSALINPKNHHFNGRDLVLEYAGADAVRRGAAKHLLPGAAAGKPAGGRRGDASSSAGGFKSRNPKSDAPHHHGGGGREDGSRNRTREPRGTDKAAADRQEGAFPNTFTSASPSKAQEPMADGGDKQQPWQRQREHKGPRTRPKPGAALALAKRETFAIIPSQGKKITF